MLAYYGVFVAIPHTHTVYCITSMLHTHTHTRMRAYHSKFGMCGCAYITSEVVKTHYGTRELANEWTPISFIKRWKKKLVQTRFQIPIPSVYNFFLAYGTFQCLCFLFLFFFRFFLHTTALLCVICVVDEIWSSETGEKKIPNISLYVCVLLILVEINSAMPLHFI